MVGGHHSAWISSHLICSTHRVAHLDLSLMGPGLLIEVLHLTIVRWIIILTIIVVGRRVVSVGVPVEGVVGVVLVT